MNRCITKSTMLESFLELPHKQIGLGAKNFFSIATPITCLSDVIRL